MTFLRKILEVFGQPELLAQYDRLYPRNYNELVNRINDDLDVVVGLIESDARDFGSAGEDLLNREIVRLLRARCYTASHDHDEGGHVDVRIASRDGRYSWLAEAKIYRSLSQLDAGMDQLIDRYARGTPGNNRGGFLLYVQRERCTDLLEEWKSFHSAQTVKYEDLTVTPCNTRPGLAFFSEFVLRRLGKGVPKYQVRHMAVSLYRRGTNAGASGAKPAKRQKNSPST